MAKYMARNRLDKPQRQSGGRYAKPHEPDLEEIAAICRGIRESWSEGEHRKRAGVDPLGPIDMAVIGLPVKVRAMLGSR